MNVYLAKKGKLKIIIGPEHSDSRLATWEVEIGRINV
jgi:hypothetical protein